MRKKAIQTRFGHYHPLFCSFFARFPPFWRNSGTLALRQQVFFTYQQVAERSQQMQSVTVFSKATIADFAIAKDLFDVPEWVFHFGPGAGFELFSFQLTVVQFLTRERKEAKKAQKDAQRNK